MSRFVPALAFGRLSLLACSSEQDPGLTPGSGDAPGTTSRTLQPCPAGGPDGGPDATTPAAGCLAEDGSVVRP